jgi:hypothetical protein
LGDRKKTSETQRKPREKEDVSLIPIANEDQEEVIYA